MKITSTTVGSWFPSGFYGHHRMRNRTDFINEYRHLAKPQPPDAFLHRSLGQGKKKHPQRSACFKSDMQWSSNISQSNSGRPMMSSYKKDFRMEEPNTQMLVKRPMTSFDSPAATTMYRTVHGTDSPNCHLINAMSNESLMLSLHSRQYQAIKRKKDPQDSVAACMSWYKPRAPSLTSNEECNHIYMQPNVESGISGSSCPQTSASYVLSECNVVKPLQESCNTIQNVPEC